MSFIDNKLPVAQAIAKQLQEMIRSGALKPGEKLASQRVLSEQLNVSRPSLREALLTLETLGLVRTLPARGTFVVDPEDDDASSTSGIWRYNDSYSIDDVFQTRILIESELCRLSATTFSPASLDALESANRTFEETWEKGDLMAHVEADLQFHRMIATCCPNKMLQRLYYSVQNLLTESQRQPIPNTEPARMAQSIAEHKDIIAALRKADPDLASKAMRSHILNTARCAGVEAD